MLQFKLSAIFILAAAAIVPVVAAPTPSPPPPQDPHEHQHPHQVTGGGSNPITRLPRPGAEPVRRHSTLFGDIGGRPILPNPLLYHQPPQQHPPQPPQPHYYPQPPQHYHPLAPPPPHYYPQHPPAPQPYYPPPPDSPPHPGSLANIPYPSFLGPNRQHSEPQSYEPPFGRHGDSHGHHHDFQPPSAQIGLTPSQSTQPQRRTTLAVDARQHTNIGGSGSQPPSVTANLKRKSSSVHFKESGDSDHHEAPNYESKRRKTTTSGQMMGESSGQMMGESSGQMMGESSGQSKPTRRPRRRATVPSSSGESDPTHRGNRRELVMSSIANPTPKSGETLPVEHGLTAEPERNPKLEDSNDPEHIYSQIRAIRSSKNRGKKRLPPPPERNPENDPMLRLIFAERFGRNKEPKNKPDPKDKSPSPPSEPEQPMGE